MKFEEIVNADPYLTIIVVAILVFIFLIIIANLLDKFYPKNKLSKGLEKISEWIKDNMRI